MVSYHPLLSGCPDVLPALKGGEEGLLMSDGMTVEIDVIRGAGGAGADSLVAWLRAEAPELSLHAALGRDVFIEADAMPVPAGRRLVVVSLESSSAAAAFASALTAFLRRVEDMTLSVTTDVGRTMVLHSGDTRVQVTQVIESLVAVETGEAASADPADANTNPQRPRIRVQNAFEVDPPGDDGRVTGFLVDDGQRESRSSDRLTMPVTIYLSEAEIHGQVESAVERLLGKADLLIEDREEPLTGSWFRRMKAVARSPAAREAALVAAHAADTRVTLAQDAAVTATLLQNLGPVIASLQPTKDAVLRIGALLIVKVDWAVNVFQLTAAQQALLDHRPQLAFSPHEIIAALNLTPSSEESNPQALR